MYGDFILLESDKALAAKLPRITLRSGATRNEAWLRDLIFHSPELLPVRQLDPSFRQIVALCTELQTTAGPIDVALISPDGRLVLVETKLWRNPQARREVVAQILDYSRTLSKWSYSDLQREVNARTGSKGNSPFAITQKLVPELDEQEFVNAVTSALRLGRFLLLIVGDGIHEDVQSIAELVNRNAASAFELALVEMALYEDPRGGLLVQPRVTAKTETIHRTFVMIDNKWDENTTNQTEPDKSGKHEEYKKWWRPILEMTFDDPDQPPPTLHYPNNIRLPLPIPGLGLAAYGTVSGSRARHGVWLSGGSDALLSFWSSAGVTPEQLAGLIPDCQVQKTDDGVSEFLKAERMDADFPDDDACRKWIAQTLNAFVNTLRPRLPK